MWKIGTPVLATHNPEHDCEYVEAARAERKECHGKFGVVVNAADAHGLCFLVDHGGGLYAWWEPDELSLVVRLPGYVDEIELTFAVDEKKAGV